MDDGEVAQVWNRLMDSTNQGFEIGFCKITSVVAGDFSTFFSDPVVLRIFLSKMLMSSWPWKDFELFL